MFAGIGFESKDGRKDEEGFAFGGEYEFRFHPLAEERNGGPVLYLQPVDDSRPWWEAWAVRGFGARCE